MSFRVVLTIVALLSVLLVACGTDDLDFVNTGGVGAEPTVTIVEPTLIAEPSPTMVAPTTVPEPTPTPTPITILESVDTEILYDELGALGAAVEIVGHVKFNSLFGRWPSELTVNGQAVRIYQFATSDAMQKASETVGPGGYHFTTFIEGDIRRQMILEWIEPPHFYLFENSIVLYFGVDGKIGELLDSVGTKFAGRLLKSEDSFEWVVVPAVVDEVTIWSPHPRPEDYTVAIMLEIAQCDEKDEITMELLEQEIRFVATMRVTDPPAECIGDSFNPGESFDLGSDFEDGVEYQVTVNGDPWGSFVGGVPLLR